MFVQWAAHQERVRARGALRATPDGQLSVEPYLTEEQGTTPPVGGFSWRRFFRPAFGVAAAAAAAMVLLLVIPRSGDDDFAAMLQPMTELGEEVRLRSDPPTGQEETFAGGVDAYERGDLRAAVDLLEDADVTSRLDNLRRVYLGSAYARLGEYEEAVRVLEKVSFVSVPDPWGGEGRWTLYVAYRASRRDAEAEAILEELAREPGEFGDRARDALNEH
jgi:tetratricopeptide (TPR) repeat protein